MLTALNNDLKPFEDLITKFSREELKPHVEVHDRYPFGDLDVGVIEAGFKKIYDLGFLGIMLPEKYTGIGQGISTLCMMLGHVAEVDASYSLIIFTSALSQEIILSAQADSIAENLSKGKRCKGYLVAFRHLPIPAGRKPCRRLHLPARATLTGKLDYLVLGSFSKWAVIPAGLRATRDIRSSW